MGIEGIMGIQGIMTGAKAAVDATKTALDIANKLQNIELKAAILDLKEEILALREENIALKEQLQKQSDLEMVFENNCYWRKKEDGSKEGPFCPSCKDSKQLKVQMKDCVDSYACTSCNYWLYKNSNIKNGEVKITM